MNLRGAQRYALFLTSQGKWRLVGQIKVNDLPGFNEFFSIEYDTEEEARESLAYHVARIRAEESSAYTQITEWQP